MARRGAAWPGKAWHGMAWPGKAWQGKGANGSEKACEKSHAFFILQRCSAARVEIGRKRAESFHKTGKSQQVL